MKNFTEEALRQSKVWELNEHLFLPKKKAKYGNVKIVIDGLTFDSKKESRRYIELRALQTIGEITDLKTQVPFQLSVCKYISDFTYLKDGQLIVEDVKSKMTRTLPTYRLKKKMMLAELGITIKEV
jgi:succinylglutamate desuccinylase